MKKILYVLLGGAIAISGSLFYYTASANPTYFLRFSSASATTTIVYMTPGTGTTTVTASNPTQSAFDSAVVNVQVTATSTGVVGAVILNAIVEGSNDDQNTVQDWYPLAIAANTSLGTTPGNATTTLITSNPYNIIQLVIATSSLSTGGTGTLTRIHEEFAIPTYTRHVRVKLYDPASGGNYGLWAEIVAKKQTP